MCGGGKPTERQLDLWDSGEPDDFISLENGVPECTQWPSCFLKRVFVYIILIEDGSNMVISLNFAAV